MLTVKGKYLYKDGKKFFYLADTCWGAFGSIDMPDWRYYLDTRKAEGFNVIQINVLRQWDSSLPNKEPFVVTTHEDGFYEYDYSKINESYFDNATKMLDEMQIRGITPALVLLWGNFVPGTWMSKYVKNNPMPLEKVEAYVSYVVNKLKKYHPIWIVSGDVGFSDNEKQTVEPATSYYRKVIDTAQSIDPDDLYTFHINGESTEIPFDLFKKADFFVYQSGHGYSGQSTAYTIPQRMRKKGYSGPIIDAELCYEGLTKMKAPTPERYSAYDVRRAAWRAVLSGADAGLGYGAFGIWPWNDTARPEAKIESNFNVQLVPYDWRDCLNFRGAKDVAFIKTFIDEDASEGLNSISNPMMDNPEIRVAETDRYVFIYLPTPETVDFKNLGMKVKECKVIDLNTRHIMEGKIKNNNLQLLPVVEDELVIIEKD